MPKVSYAAGPDHIGQHLRIVTKRYRVRVFTAKCVFTEVNVGSLADITHSSGLSIGPDIGAQVRNPVAIRQNLAVLSCPCSEARDSELAQREQFLRLTKAILIQIAPHTELIPSCVLSVQHPICVRIKISQSGKAISSLRARRKDGAITKEFVSVVDAAIAVAI
ncbi:MULTISPECIES: hypothetical protein [Ralstonia solanacearum species complex]|uniref:hypothetical protein n=1 Tax=Ralstonia solanacearum species complex TaxID=3116862 RepID=UPI0013C2CD26|nr:hypothetical protein [Ralstonia solanacearum]BEU73403.1 hypothetical protein MAFF211271_29580 [Ralstonia pseudosolanacearum]